MQYLKLVVYLSLIVTIGCTSKPTNNNLEFSPIVNRFLLEGASRRVTIDPDNLTIELVDKFSPELTGLSPGTIAVCNYANNHVEVLSGAWNSINEVTKELTIFHELGHCLLGLRHAECPSVMCWHMDTVSIVDYEINRTMYLDGLFKH